MTSHRLQQFIEEIQQVPPNPEINLKVEVQPRATTPQSVGNRSETKEIS